MNPARIPEEGTAPGATRPGRRDRRSTLRALVLLGLVAIVAAVPRFGSRENPAAQVSDSDYYLDMVQVFAGEREAFHPAHSAPGQSGSRHYARPLLSLLASPLVRLGVSPALAMSAVSLASAWGFAAAFYLVLCQASNLVRLAWLPPALFLTGFPQVNWGYHVLTDSLGYFTAFLACLASLSFLRWKRAHPTRDLEPSGVLALLGIGTLQASAFLARETAWFTLVVVLVVVVWERCWQNQRGVVLALVSTLLLAKLPHMVYVWTLGVKPLQISFAPAAWLDPVYMADFLAKSALAFHIAWLLALSGLRRGNGRDVPPWLLGWGVAALLYIVAGYAHNSLDRIGYPLRLTYALFPQIYILAAWALEARPWPGIYKRAAAVFLVLANGIVSLIGVALDPGTSVILAPGPANAAAAVPNRLVLDRPAHSSERTAITPSPSAR